MAEELSNVDRRTHPRFQINQMIEVSLGREKSLRVTGQNISEGGLLCESDQFVEPYTNVFIAIESPRDEAGAEAFRLRIEGVVLRCEEISTFISNKLYNMGIEFTGLFDDSIEKLQRFVRPLSEE